MEQNISPDQSEAHSSSEFKNLWACQKVIRDWKDNPQWSSYDVLPILYTTLHTGKRYVPDAKNAPKLASVLRNTNAILQDYPNKVLPQAEDVYTLTSKFTTKFDELLNKTPKTIEQTISDAAFSYYALCRIHPFPDGNGRIGRMLVKAIFKRAGLKDPVFHDQRWYGGDRSEHLEAIEKVDETNNLAPLEIFFAKSLVDMYDPIRDFLKYRGVTRVISDKEKALKQNNILNLSDVWEGFASLPPYEKR